MVKYYNKYLKYLKYLTFIIAIAICILANNKNILIKMNTVYQSKINLSNGVNENLNIKIEDEQLVKKSNEIFDKLLNNNFDTDDYNVSIDFIKGYNYENIASLRFINKINKSVDYVINYDIELGELYSIRILFTDEPKNKTTNLSNEELSEKAYNFLLRLPLINPEGIEFYKNQSDIFIFYNKINKQEYLVRLNKLTGGLMEIILDIGLQKILYLGE